MGKTFIGAARALSAAALMMLAAAPAWAQALAQEAPSAAQPAPSAESDRLGVEMAHILMGGVDYKAILSQNIGELDQTFGQIKGRPEWADLFKQAFLEEVDQDRPAFDRIIGLAFAQYFTLDELRAGTAFLRGPGGAALAQIVADSSAGKPPGTLSPDVQREMTEAAQTPAGRSFFEKFGQIGPVMDKVQPDFVAAFLPGVFRRFGEKAEADEAARQAGR
jgi:hypothetical protein